MFARTLTIAAAAIGVGWLASQSLTAPSAPLAEAVPADDCRAYFEFRGLADQPDWDQTAARQSLIDSGLMKTIRRAISKEVMRDWSRSDKKIGKALEDNGETAVRWAMDNGFAIAVYRRDGRDEPVPYLFLPNADEVIAFAESIAEDETIRQAEEFVLERAGDGRLSFGTKYDRVQLLQIGDTLVAAATGDDLDALQAAFSGGFTDVQTHPLYPKQTDDAVAVGFGDIGSAIDRLSDQRVRGKNSPTVGEVLAVPGLQTLRSAQTVSRIDGEAIRCVSQIRTDGQPTSVVKEKLTGPKMTLADLPPLPKTATGFAAVRTDAATLTGLFFDRMMPLVEKYDPQQKARMDADYADFSEDLGVDIINELLPAFGDVLCIYDDAVASPIEIPVNLVAAVDDRKTIVSSFSRFVDLAEGELPPDQFRVTKTPGEQFDQITIAGNGIPVSVVLAVGDEWALISANPQAASAFFTRGFGDSLQVDAETLARNPKLGGEFMGMSWVDPKAAYERGVLLAGMGLPFAGQAIGTPLVMPVLPSSSTVTGPMFPNVSVVTADADGVEIETTTSVPAFPGASTVATGQLAIFGGLAAAPFAIGSPAAAAVQNDKNSLKQAGLACWNYSDTYKGFPSGTIVDSADKVNERLSMNVELLPFMGEYSLYQEFDRKKPFLADDNRYAASSVIDAFVPVGEDAIVAINADGTPAKPGQGTLEFAATYLIGNGGVNIPGQPAQAGAFDDAERSEVERFTDGLSNTLLFFTTNKPAPYAQGGRATVRALTEPTPTIGGKDGIGGLNPGSFPAGFCDGMVLSISDSIDPAVLKALMTADGGESVDF